MMQNHKLPLRRQLRALSIGILSCGLLSWGVLPPAFAQIVAQSVPGAGGINAGTEQQRFQQQTDDAFQKLPSHSDDDVLEENNNTPSYGGDDEARVVLQTVDFEGNQAFSKKRLQPFTEDIIGKPITLQEINDVLTQLKRHYRNHGFISVYVYIKPQDLQQGNLLISIVEGTLGEIHFEGNKHYSNRVLKSQIAIDAGDVISYENFVSDLIRLNKNRNIDAKATFHKGKNFGETDVLISVEDRRRFHVTGIFNNFVSNNVGGLRGGAGIDFDSPLGLMDHFSANYQMGADTWAINADYNVPINSMGTRIGTSYAHSDVDVGGPLAPLNLNGRARSHTGYINHPFIEKEFFTLTGTAGFDWKNAENRIFNQTFTKEKLRVAHGGFALEKKWPKLGGITYANASARFGLGSILGGTTTGDAVIRARTSNKFFVTKANVDHYQNLGKGIIGRVRSSAQFTPDRLPTLEQSRLGGNYSIRGYQEGEQLADNSVLVSGEVYFPFFLVPKSWKLPFAEKPLRDQIQPFVFADYGYGRINNAIGGADRAKSLLGVGGGVRVHLYKKVFGRAEWAAPLGATPTDGRNYAFYFNLNVEAL